MHVSPQLSRSFNILSKGYLLLTSRYVSAEGAAYIRDLYYIYTEGAAYMDHSRLQRFDTVLHVLPLVLGDVRQGSADGRVRKRDLSEGIHALQ